MIHKIAEKMINWQIVKGNLTETDRNKYVYAYEILFNQLVNLSIAVVNGAKIDTLISIAELFHITLDYLVCGCERKAGV